MTRSCAVFVDAGTTNTRVWLVSGDRIVARADAMAGVRDTARDGDSSALRNALRRLIAEVSTKGEPSFVAAAGMITSSLGLAEVPHIEAPAGPDELAAAVRRFDFPEITNLPVFLVPGVRTGPIDAGLDSVETADLMRGEETLCIGLIESGLAPRPCTVLNLGSHWKLIGIDAEGRIAASRTSMSGEMIHAMQTQTILASAVPHSKPEDPEMTWVEAGMAEQRRSGLARAMFCVRLLEQGRRSTPEQRLGFLVGAFIASDLDPLIERGAISSTTLITGGGAIAECWKDALSKAAIDAVIIDSENVERALLTGLQKISRAVPV